MDAVAPPFANSDEGSEPLLSGLANGGLLQGTKLYQINPIVGKSFRFFTDKSALN